MSPKRAWKRPTVCGVSPISGTRTIAPRPAASVAWTAWRYTSVLPEPVTPCRRKRSGAGRSPSPPLSGQETLSARTVAPERGQDRLERPLLIGGQRGRPVQPASHGHCIRPRCPLERAMRDQAARLEPAQRGRAERRGQTRAARLKARQRGPLAIG